MQPTLRHVPPSVPLISTLFFFGMSWYVMVCHGMSWYIIMYVVLCYDIMLFHVMIMNWLVGCLFHGLFGYGYECEIRLDA